MKLTVGHADDCATLLAIVNSPHRSLSSLTPKLGLLPQSIMSSPDPAPPAGPSAQTGPAGSAQTTTQTGLSSTQAGPTPKTGSAQTGPSRTRAGKKRELSPNWNTLADNASEALTILEKFRTVTQERKTAAKKAQSNIHYDQLSQKLEEIRDASEAIPHTTFSKVNLDVLSSIGIVKASRYGLVVQEDKIPEIETLGNADGSAQTLRLPVLTDLIRLLRDRIPFSVCLLPYCILQIAHGRCA